MNVEALDLLATSVFLVNGRGHIEYANAAAEDLFGRSRKQLCGQSAATLFDSPEHIQSSIDRAAGGRYADVRQLAFLRRAMESVEVSVTTVGLTGQRWPVLIERARSSSACWPIAVIAWSRRSRRTANCCAISRMK